MDGDSAGDLQEELKKAQAEAARLRQKLQKIRGALYCLRHPEDAGKPVVTWRFNPAGMKSLSEHYELPELMNSTAPEGDGTELLMELRELREQAERDAETIANFAREKLARETGT
jgi:molecular chaperone GrpE (heat shock protein)